MDDSIQQKINLYRMLYDASLKVVNKEICQISGENNTKTYVNLLNDKEITGHSNSIQYIKRANIFIKHQLMIVTNNLNLVKIQIFNRKCDLLTEIKPKCGVGMRVHKDVLYLEDNKALIKITISGNKLLSYVIIYDIQEQKILTMYDKIMDITYLDDEKRLLRLIVINNYNIIEKFIIKVIDGKLQYKSF